MGKVLRRPQRFEIELLALTHLSTRYFPREIRDEARAVFEHTVVPRDFDAIDIRFPERGAPELIRASDAPPPPPEPDIAPSSSP